MLLSDYKYNAYSFFKYKDVQALKPNLLHSIFPQGDWLLKYVLGNDLNKVRRSGNVILCNDH